MVLNDEDKKRKLCIEYQNGNDELYDKKSYIIKNSKAEAKQAAYNSMLSRLSDILMEKDGFFGKKNYHCSYCEEKLYGKIVIKIPYIALLKTPPSDAKKDVKKIIKKGYAYNLDFHVICNNCEREQDEITGYYYYA